MKEYYNSVEICGRISENYPGNFAIMFLFYVVNLDDCLYVLHAFQKKSKSGIKTPKPDLNIIEARLKQLKMVLQRGEL